jgi:dienelactone hydrolase
LKIQFFLPFLLSFLIISNYLYAQSASNSGSKESYPASVSQFLQSLYTEQNQKYTFRKEYPGGFRTWHREAASELCHLISLDIMQEQIGKFEQKVRLLEKQNKEGYTLQKGFITTEPLVEIPFWLLIPKGKGPFPLAVLPHGHDKRGLDTSAGVYHDEAHRKKSIAGDRDVAVQAVKRGFIAIAPAIRGLAEEAPGVPDIRKRHGDRDCRSQFMHCLLAGRTAIAERVWDMMRILDWAIKLPDVNPSTILMMGNSGGGMVTLYTAACDERITIAVPSCSFSVLTSPQGYIYHCDCNAIPGIFTWGNLYDVAGLIAPRYLLTVNGLKDRLHSVDDINRAARHVREIYQAAGVPSHYDHRWGAEGHRFYKDLMWPFISNAIKNDF